MPNNALEFRASVMKELWSRNMTISQLAREIRYSRGHLSRVLNGQVDSPETVQAIRSYLNIPTA